LVADLYVSTLADGTYIFLPLALLLNALLPNVGGVVALTVALVRLKQWSKAISPILVTPLGITILVRLVQL
jgi:hypothetical protein